jgi:hypothetical protein
LLGAGEVDAGEYSGLPLVTPAARKGGAPSGIGSTCAAPAAGAGLAGAAAHTAAAAVHTATAVSPINFIRMSRYLSV